MASSCLAAFLLVAIPLVGCVNARTNTRPTPMFVFGDSYADTGNSEQCAPSWQPPYGQTWPGVPAGRYSDGKILPDNIASFLNIDTPTPYINISLGSCEFPSGINFAHGGTGIFRTKGTPEGPTLHFQIEQFQLISKDCSDIQSLIDSSLVLVVMVGNDYISYLQDHPHDFPGLLLVIPSVVKGIADSIRELYNIGFRKFAIANLEPSGCAPVFATDNYTQCNDAVNFLSESHNALLALGILELEIELDGIKIITLNQYKSFGNAQQNIFGNNLAPCINSTTNIVRVCSDPENFFFWDVLHPTQAGWKAVSDTYKEDILKLVEDGTNINGQSLRFKA